MENEMSAKLWEDTVVTAIRDEKWLHAVRHRLTTPPPQITLKGNAEQRLGDLLDITDDRFFLLEVKGTRQDIKSEWSTNNSKNNYQKDAYRAHLSWINSISDQQNKTNLGLSLRCHFFAYWVEFSSIEEEKSIPIEQMTWRNLLNSGECVSIEPYALACQTFEKEQPEDAKIKGFISNACVGILNKNTESFICRQQIPISLIYEGLGYLIREDKSAPYSTAAESWQLGAKLQEFKGYLSALCGFAGNSLEPIHAIVMSSSGKFFRIKTTTADLKDLLDPSPKSNARKLHWPQKSLPKMSKEAKKSLQLSADQESTEVDVKSGRGFTP